MLTVKFSGSVPDLADEERHAELPRIPLSPRDHQPRRLAVSPLRCELSRCRRSPSPPRHHGVLRSDPAVVLTFGSAYARRLKRRQGRLGDIWHLDEVFVTIQGRRHYLWRAVDQDGDVLDILVQSRRDCRAAKRFFRKLLQGQERQPGRLVTDKLSSYKAAHRVVMPSVAHRTDRYANNRAEVSHQPTRQRERQMRRFKSAAHAQRFLSVHGLVLNLFRVGRHLLRSAHHRLLRMRAFAEWDTVTCAC